MEFKTVKIPSALYEKIKEKIEGTSFSSVDEYVQMRLEQEFPQEPTFTEEEERLIRERLRRLGYIQ